MKPVMDRRVAGLLALGLASWLLVLVATFPAAHAFALFASPSVDASGVRGTVWNGSAARVDYGGPAALTAVNWGMSVWPLLIGRIDADTRFAWAGLEGHGRVVHPLTGGLEVRDLALRGSANGLGALLPAVPSQFGGTVSAHLERFRLSDGRILALSGRLQWKQAGVTAPFRLDLGELRVESTPSEGDPGYRIATNGRGGALDIQGAIRLRPDGRYSTNLRLAPTAEAPDGLAATLAGMAQREGNAFRFRRSGRLQLTTSGS